MNTELTQVFTISLEAHCLQEIEKQLKREEYKLTYTHKGADDFNYPHKIPDKSFYKSTPIPSKVKPWIGCHLALIKKSQCSMKRESIEVEPWEYCIVAKMQDGKIMLTLFP